MNNLVIFVAVTIGFAVGYASAIMLIFGKTDALMGVDTSDPDTDRYKMVILCPLKELRKKKYLIVEVKEANNEEQRNSGTGYSN